MITAQIARFLLKEHCHRPISGELLCIGRQTIAMTFAEACALLLEEGISPRYQIGRAIEIDEVTTAGIDARRRGIDYISDRQFFSMFCDANVQTLDVSGYEGAEIICDLNVDLKTQQINGALHHSVDFIFNGSCLDNLFNPAQALMNLSFMLRPEGRILSFEHGSLVQSAYLAYSPEWFWGFFSANDYADAKIWIASPIETDRNTPKAKPSLQGNWLIQEWKPQDQIVGIEDFMVVCLAEKGKLSANGRIPRQEHYQALYGESAGRMYVSPRRFVFPRGVSRALVPWR